MNAPYLEILENTLKINGNIYFENVDYLCQAGKQYIVALSEIGMDFSGLNNCDSSILALCSEWMRTALQLNKKITFLNPPSFMQDLLELHGLDKLLPGVQNSI